MMATCEDCGQLAEIREEPLERDIIIFFKVGKQLSVGYSDHRCGDRYDR